MGAGMRAGWLASCAGDLAAWMAACLGMHPGPTHPATQRPQSAAAHRVLVGQVPLLCRSLHCFERHVQRDGPAGMVAHPGVGWAQRLAPPAAGLSLPPLPACRTKPARPPT